jgi:ubiquitin C-terminal hydrolase
MQAMEAISPLGETISAVAADSLFQKAGKDQTNLSNTCYINAVVQALARANIQPLVELHCRPFTCI